MTTPKDNKGKRPRRSRDSSLYRDLYKDETQPEGGDAAEPGANRGYRFVLSDEPEVVPVDHQAVIESLTSQLERIADDREKLEAELGRSNSANKLEIAQIKGRLAALNRKQSEIEALLMNSRAAAAKDPQG